MAKKDLRRGNPGNKGGGRKPDWLKAKCQGIIADLKLIEFLGQVASGKDVDQRINENGECLKVPADVKDRLKALDMLLDRGFGKPLQQVESESLQEFARTILVRPIE